MLDVFKNAVLAFTGGVILNAMPCVFPVLALKVASFTAQFKGSPVDKAVASRLRKGSLYYSFGVISGVSLLLFILLGFEALGYSVGWGYQMQSDAFLASIVIACLFSGFSLSGIFEIPGFFPSAIGVGSGKKDHAFASEFSVGVFAVFVTTSCGAPFMAPAIAFALFQHNILFKILVFEAFAFGVAFPYVALSLFPTLVAKVLPKPGPWLSTFKKLLAFPMYFAAAWFAKAVFYASSPEYAFHLISWCIFVILCIELYRIIGFKSKTKKIIFKSIAAVMCLGFFYEMNVLEHAKANESISSRVKNESIVFSQKKLDELLANGERVFVAVGAEWCAVCKINESVLFSRNVLNFLHKKKIILMHADWTRQDDKITDYMKKMNYAGVPMYILHYAKGNNAVEKLPQILTFKVISEAVKNAENAVHHKKK